MANNKTTLEEFQNDLISKDKSDYYKDSFEFADKLAKFIGKISSTRINKGLSQRELAKRTGLKQSTIGRIETLTVIPSLSTILIIANALDLSVDLLDYQFTIEKEMRIDTTYKTFDSALLNKSQKSFKQKARMEYCYDSAK